MIQQHKHMPQTPPTMHPTVTETPENELANLKFMLEKLVEAMGVEWCEECNAFVENVDESGTQDPAPHLLDSLNPDSPNADPPGFI